MILAERLGRSNRGVEVFRDLTFEVARRECVAIVGANAAVRSAVLRVLATLLSPSTGQFTVDGVDAVRRPYDARRRAFYAGATSHTIDVRADDYLRLATAGRQVHAVNDGRRILALAGLEARTTIQALSVDERYALQLAAAVTCGAPLVLIDEAPAGADSIQRERYRGLIAEARHCGATLVLAARSEAQVPTLSDRILALPAFSATAAMTSGKTEA